MGYPQWRASPASDSGMAKIWAQLLFSGDALLLPADLRLAVAHPQGGRVVLVIGAGCSVEAPTGLPLARQCASEAHRRLVEDGVLAPGACPDPTDLSVLADTVVATTGGQAELVRRLPREAFRVATPNGGHLIAAALLREQAVACVLTLNFDLAMSAALSQLGAREVTVVAGPGDHDAIGITSVVYLNRNADADPETWILRTADLDDGWRGQWEEVVAHRFLSGPVTVFAGLGSPAGVLTESTRRIREAVLDAARVYLVDPVDQGQSAFATLLAVEDGCYLEMGWCEFAAELADRLVVELRAALEQACDGLQQREGWSENYSETCARLVQGGLVAFGQLRAKWILSPRPYVSGREVDPELIADLTLGISLVERTTGSEAVFAADGIVDFGIGQRIIGCVVPASGRGVVRWHSMEAELSRRQRQWAGRYTQPEFALVAGISGERKPSASPPPDITGDEDEGSILTLGRGLRLTDVDELRADPGLVTRWVA